jgi:acetyl-CoA synthetase
VNACYNCVDRHVEAGRGEKVAFYWEGDLGADPTGRPA